jgi:transcriptional regulator with GAF, ATPase, and Fis domain
MPISKLSEGTDVEAFERYVAHMRATGPSTIGGFHRRKDGTRFPVEVRSRLFHLRGRWCVLSLARDVTERIQAEEQRRQLALERGYLLEELEMERNFGEIVGTAPSMRKLFRDIDRVAATDSTVLVTGETGTGKELVARAIHRASGRKDKVLVKVNCAALSAGLIESELFGHEKGAFTGAIARRVGRFELASGGTIFLDEIGDLSAEVQAKLLRVLQEGEFERVGGMKTLSVDVRVIAATNRDLERAVEHGEFRADLFYRLNVFPLHVPPLRDRPEDLPLLVSFLLRRYGAKLGKQFQPVEERALRALADYSWPGNVRELENVIERAAIVSQGDRLDLSEWLKQPAATQQTSGVLTLDEVQRRHILDVLTRTGWRVSGPKGAARILGMEPSTLTSRMGKLGIKRPR